MPPPYCYDHPRPAVTVDLAAFARDGESDSLRVLLIRRKNEPFAGTWALPGGFVDLDEPIETAARRELKEETGLEIDGSVLFVGVYGDPGRDPRGRTISLVYAAMIPGPLPAISGADDAEEAAWVDPREPRQLAFDHATILKDAIALVERSRKAG